MAEELNFTRAAGRLHIAQQALSAQIRQLEQRVGTPLLTRTTRKVTLTPAGQELLGRARDVIAAADDAVAAARAAAGEEAGTLTVGLLATGALDLTPRVLRAYASERPRVELFVKSIGFDDPSGGVRDGTTEVALVWTPFASDGLDVEDLIEVPRVALLPPDHSLAAESIVRAVDLAREPFVWVEGVDPVAGDFWTLAAHRSGPLRIGARITSFDDAFAAVRAGQAVMAPPEPLAGSFGLPGLVVRPIAGLAPARVALCRRRGEPSSVVHAFLAAARACAEREMRSNE